MQVTKMASCLAPTYSFRPSTLCRLIAPLHVHWLQDPHARCVLNAYSFALYADKYTQWVAELYLKVFINGGEKHEEKGAERGV